MNAVLFMLFLFIGLGLMSRSLGRATFVLMGVVILFYLLYAYSTG